MQHAWQLFVRGNLAKSQQESDLAYNQFRLSNPAWALKFKLLEAESMLYRGMYEDALEALADYPNTGPDDGTIEKLAIEAVALTRQQQLPLADQKLTMAETMCGAVQALPHCGEVLSARAILAVEIRAARAMRGSRFLRHFGLRAATTTRGWRRGRQLNLGYMALQVDHYDEAVDWSMSAYQRGCSFGFRKYCAEALQGNLGWAYYQLGDDERALEQFLAAEKTAARLGNVRDRAEMAQHHRATFIATPATWSRAARFLSPGS